MYIHYFFRFFFYYLCAFFFFFSSRRRHTRWTGDWSSDVCSSDLGSHTQSFNSGQTISSLPLETAETINNAWGFNLTDDRYKSVPELIRYLVRAAGKIGRASVGKECRSRWWADQ